MLSGPLVCQLCDADFITEREFGKHKDCEHAGEKEYRKRVLYLVSKAGCRPITGQEKRIMVQNFARFQQFSRPGAKGNYFADCEEVPRAEAGCAICSQKDWLEHRHKLGLFGCVPYASDVLSVNAPAAEEHALDEEDEAGKSSATPIASTLLKHRGVYYIQSPAKVHKFLDVDRYVGRWPLIPGEELHASSVEHPEHPEWRWLLHTRRVPVLENTSHGNAPLMENAARGSGASQPAALSSASQPAAGCVLQDRPPCAGVGDSDGIVWACWECLSSLGTVKPSMPLNGLTNDNWIGREKKHVRDASTATKMLSSLARCCFKQVRLGKGAPDTRQKAICGNTIFLAQPTAEIPSLTLPPPDDALVDSGFNVIFTRSVHDLSSAHWATVKRAEYLRIVRERKKECASFAD